MHEVTNSNHVQVSQEQSQSQFCFASAVSSLITVTGAWIHDGSFGNLNYV